MSTQRLHSLDGLRGAAALAVAVFHFSSGSTVNDIAFAANGWLSVDIFFVISGVVLDRRYFSNPSTNFYEYFAARSGRMLPVYFLMFGLFLAMEIGLYIARNGDLGNLIWPAIVNILALQSFGVLDKLWFYGPSWSISAEIWVNLFLFPLLFLARGTWSTIAIVVLSSIIFITTLDIQSSYDYGWLRCLYGIGVGVLASRYAHRVPSWTPGGTNNTHLRLLPQGLSLLWFVLLYATYAIPILHHFAPLIFGVLVLALMTSIVPLANRFFSTFPLTYLGKISFAMYMTHYFIGGRVLRMLIPILDRQTDVNLVRYTDQSKWNGLVLGTTEVQGLIFLSIYLFLVVLVAHYTLKWVEAPLYAKSKAWIYRILVNKGCE